MFWGNLAQLRRLNFALLDAKTAARVKITPVGRVGWISDITL